MDGRAHRTAGVNTKPRHQDHMNSDADEQDAVWCATLNAAPRDRAEDCAEILACGLRILDMSVPWKSTVSRRKTQGTCRDTSRRDLMPGESSGQVAWPEVLHVHAAIAALQTAPHGPQHFDNSHRFENVSRCLTMAVHQSTCSIGNGRLARSK